MARDSNKNAYSVVRIPLASVVFQALGEEPKNTGVSIAKLIPVKLYEHYTGQVSTHQISSVDKIKPDGAEQNALAFLESEG